VVQLWPVHNKCGIKMAASLEDYYQWWAKCHSAFLDWKSETDRNPMMDGWWVCLPQQSVMVP
jgi:hypothetical protein